jgi:hypothetical protein
MRKLPSMIRLDLTSYDPVKLDWSNFMGYMCSFSTCLRTFSGSGVRNNRLEETIVPDTQTTLGSPKGTYFLIVDTYCLRDRELQEQLLQTLRYKFESSAR